jgi:hypothetical protein
MTFLELCKKKFAKVFPKPAAPVASPTEEPRAQEYVLHPQQQEYLPTAPQGTARYSPSFAERARAQEQHDYPAPIVTVSRGFNGAPEFREVDWQGNVIARKPVKKPVW